MKYKYRIRFVLWPRPLGGQKGMYNVEVRVMSFWWKPFVSLDTIEQAILSVETLELKHTQSCLNNWSSRIREQHAIKME